MLGGHTVVSIGPWNLPSGDEFRHYQQVTFVEDPAQIAGHD